MAIRFKVGTFLPQHPAGTLLDRMDENLSAVSGKRFLLDGDAWEFLLDDLNLTTISLAASGKPRTSQKSFPDSIKAESELAKLRLEKMGKGFLFRATEPLPSGWSHALQFLLSRVHTGFQSLDYVPEEEQIVACRACREPDRQECELVYAGARSGEGEERRAGRKVSEARVHDLPDGSRVCRVACAAKKDANTARPAAEYTDRGGR